MSAGAFDINFYETNLGVIIPMITQPETLEATIGGTLNDSATGPAAAGYPTVSISRSRRSHGIHARKVNCTWDDGAAPTGYQDGAPFSLVVPDPALWATITRGTAITYLGGTGKASTVTPEKIT